MRAGDEAICPAQGWPHPFRSDHREHVATRTSADSQAAVAAACLMLTVTVASVLDWGQRTTCTPRKWRHVLIATAA
jgi:hypothetical protein